MDVQFESNAGVSIACEAISQVKGDHCVAFGIVNVARYCVKAMSQLSWLGLSLSLSQRSDPPEMLSLLSWRVNDQADSAPMKIIGNDVSSRMLCIAVSALRVCWLASIHNRAIGNAASAKAQKTRFHSAGSWPECCFALLRVTAVLSVTTFWSFQREFSRRTGRNVLNSIQLIDLPDPGTKMGPWKPKHARRRHTTTVSRSSCVRRRILRVPFDTESLDQRHAAG